MMMNLAELLGLKMTGRVPLSDAMLIDILVYLPVKSIIRFRCVSKHWCSLIKSPTFLNRHLKCDFKKSLLLKRYFPPPHNELEPGGDDVLSFHDPDSPELLLSPDLFVPFLKDTYGCQQASLFGPCNGLVCLQSQNVIVLCNPALREFKRVDPSPFSFPENHCTNTSGSGFGYDPNTNDYKIIQLWEISDFRDDYGDDGHVRIDLYNLRTNSWRLIDDIVPRVTFDPGFNIFFNGACHWNANEYIEGPPAMGTILSFNVSTEVFQKFEFPNNWLDDGRSPSLVILNQCLGLVRYYGGWEAELHPVDIWIMKEYGVKESWTKELVMGPYLFKCPLLCWRNEWLLVETRDRQLAYFGINENEIRRFKYYGAEDSFRALIFTESLISLNEVTLN